MSTPYPRVGVGVILTNRQGQVLLGKRKGSHAPTGPSPAAIWSWETFESAAIREVAEETGFQISNPSVIAVTNNLETWRESGLHYVSVTLLAEVEESPSCWSRRSAKAGSGAIRAICRSPTSMPAANR
ncbi:NUDIX domain-containing protein [Aeromonas hydrophila]|uniref:NUDIX domain-containing protein n=1 Tax=Aeromonas hydrophila TaxID=644 RepID=A0A926IYT5_AERHY|nr:NUDIX domain-containing protein [Aeromonas hydrophila]